MRRLGFYIDVIMKIALPTIESFLGFRANTVQSAQMANAFAEIGHEVWLICLCPKNMSEGDLDIRIRSEYGLHDHVNIVFYRDFLGEIRGYEARRTIPIFGLIHHIRPDLVFSRSLLNFLYAYIKGSDNWIYEMHMVATYSQTLLKKWLDRNLRRVVNQSERCFIMIAISEKLREYCIKQGINADRIKALHDGVDPSLFNRLSKTDARARIGWNSDSRIILYIGSLARNRGIDKIVVAAREHADIEFYMIGGPEEEYRHYANYIYQNKLRHVHVLPQVPYHDIPTYLAAADALLMCWSSQVPTINHCSPMKMFEYMAAERPILGHWFPTILEVLNPEHDAILFEPDSATAISEAVERFKTDRYLPDMPRNARAKVCSSYTWAKRATAIIDFFSRIRC